MKKRLKNFRVILPFSIIAIVIVALLVSAQLPSSVRKTQYSLPEARYVTLTLSAIQKEYLDRERINPRQMLEGALDFVQRKVPEVLAQFEDQKSVLVTVDVASKRFSLKDLDSVGGLKNTLQDILSFIDMHYTGDLERPDIEYAAIDGILSTLDPHSSFMPPKVYQEFKVGTKGEFGGLGIVISVKDGNLTVIAPLDGTPAAFAGIKAGDRIVQIGDESAINMSLTDAVNMLRGEVGTKIKIVIERPGRTEPLAMTLTRALINIESVQHDVLEQNGKRIAYLKVKSFQSNTNEDVEAALKDIHSKGKIDGLILDVRNNPGGLLNQAVDLADHFINKGTIVSTVGIGGSVFDSSEAHQPGTEPDYPIAVLINEGSASASEIVAGAIKELNRGIVIGHRSFGKGSVQTIFEVGGGAALKLTIAKYLAAGSLPIQSIGLSPDVELLPVTVDRKAMDIVEDETISEKSLEKHLEEKGKEEPPAYRVRFLLPKEDESEEARSAKEYAKKPKIEDDFAVGLSRDLLAKVDDSNRKKMIGEIKDPVAVAEEGQETEIAKQLKALGIDWSSGKENGKPQLKVAFDIKKGKTALKEIKVGQEATIELKVTNIGSGPLYKLVGVGKSDSPFLVNKEFVYGKLMPGETRSWEAPLKMPDALPTEELAMEVKFEDEHSSIPVSINAVIPIKGKEPPRFAFSYKLAERGGLKALRPAHLNLDVVNIGKGTSNKDTVAQMSNESGENVFIEVGRATLGVLSPGSSKSAPFRFHLTPEAKDANVKLDMTIFDSMRIDSVNQKIKINTETGEMAPPAGKRYEPPLIEIAPYPMSTADEHVHIKGTVRDNDAIHDYFVFVGDKKVAYVSNPNGTNEVKMDVDLPLKPGENLVVVAARDANLLMARTLLAIQRTSGKKEKTTSDMIPVIPGIEE